MTQAFGGNERQAELAACIGTQMGDGLLAKTDRRAGVAGQQCFAAEQGQQLILAIAGDTGDADNFTATHFKVDVDKRAAERVRVVPGQSTDIKERITSSNLRIVGDQLCRFTDHQARQLLIRTLGRHAMPGHPTAS
ncbi:hypothetical protein D3C87_1147810 [compost metagenome]